MNFTVNEKLHNKSMKSLFEENNIKLHSTQNKGTSHIYKIKMCILTSQMIYLINRKKRIITQLK